MVFKCKMCGGDIEQIENTKTGRCVYCKSVMTLPNSDDEKIVNLYNRANFFRLNNEFDKAYEVYENILDIDDEQIEANWGLLLCKYGVEYVDDPKTKKKIPTCHRTMDYSIFTDPNFKVIKKKAYGDCLKIYEEEATEIDKIQKEILEISKKEKPYDVFICYKETNDDGERTHDSVIAQDIYDKLTNEGFKVFFARITLENKLGTKYEPYIYSALKTAKVMLVVGIEEKNFNAVWVKNEWSRYLEMMKQDKNKSLIPVYSKIDAYKLPEEFSMLQAQSMDKIGAIQDLTRGVKKLVEEYNTEDIENIDKEIVAKVRDALDEAKKVGNGQYEVTLVKEKLPAWYYVLMLGTLGILMLISILGAYERIFRSIMQINSNIKTTTIAVLYNKGVMLPTLLYGISILFGGISIISCIINRKTFKTRKYFVWMWIVSLFGCYMSIMYVGYMLRIGYANTLLFCFGILVCMFICYFINPSWKFDTSSKSIFDEQEKEKQIAKNKKIKDNFKNKEKLRVNKVFLLVLIAICIIFIVLYSNRPKQTNERNVKENQLVVTNDFINIRNESSISSEKLGEVKYGEIYTVLEQVENNTKYSRRYKWYKIKTNTGIVGWICGEEWTGGTGSIYVKLLENVNENN